MKLINLNHGVNNEVVDSVVIQDKLRSDNQSLSKLNKKKHLTDSEELQNISVDKDDNIISEQSTDDNQKATAINSTSEASTVADLALHTDSTLSVAPTVVTTTSNESLAYILGGVLLLGGIGVAVSGGDENKTEPPPTKDTQAPIFLSGTTATAITENSGAGQIIYTAKATDNVKVVAYELGGTDKAKFSINSTTGAVKLIANPDFETQANYNFSVIAKDAVGNSTVQAINLKINNVDEIVHQVPMNIVLGNHRIIEDLAGVVVGTLTTTDADSTIFTYSVNDARFEVVNGQLKLKTGVLLDFEQTPNIEVQITTTDESHLTFTKTMILTVLDINESQISGVTDGPVIITSAQPTFTPITPPTDLLLNEEYYGFTSDKEVLKLVMSSATKGTLQAVDLPDYIMDLEIINGKWYLTDGNESPVGHYVFDTLASDASGMVLAPSLSYPTWVDMLNWSDGAPVIDFIHMDSLASPLTMPTTGAMTLYSVDTSDYGDDDIYRTVIDFTNHIQFNYNIFGSMLGSASFTTDIDGATLIFSDGSEIAVYDKTGDFYAVNIVNKGGDQVDLYSTQELFDVSYYSQYILNQATDGVDAYNISLHNGNDLVVATLPYNQGMPVNRIGLGGDTSANTITITLQDVMNMGTLDHDGIHRYIKVSGGNNDTVDFVSADWILDGQFSDSAGRLYDRYASVDSDLMLHLGIQHGMMLI